MKTEDSWQKLLGTLKNVGELHRLYSELGDYLGSGAYACVAFKARELMEVAQSVNLALEDAAKRTGGAANEVIKARKHLMKETGTIVTYEMKEPKFEYLKNNS